MVINFILILTIATCLSSFVWIGNTNACPIKCICNTTKVNCQYKFLTEVPKNIPVTTTELLLDGNVITGITKDDFHGLTALRILTLTTNKISHIEPGTFDSLKHLLSLQLSDNELSNINKTLFQNLTSLFTLHLNGMSKLKPLCIEDGAFKDLKQLQQLYLAKNNMRRLTNNTFIGLERLHILDLSYNNFEIFEEHSFKYLKNTDMEIKLSIHNDWSKPPCCCSTKNAISFLNLQFVCNNTGFINDIRFQECINDDSCGVVETDTCNGITELKTPSNANVTFSALSSNIIATEMKFTTTVLPTSTMSPIQSTLSIHSFASTTVTLSKSSEIFLMTSASQSELYSDKNPVDSARNSHPSTSAKIKHTSSTLCMMTSCQSECIRTIGHTCLDNTTPPQQEKSTVNTTSGLQTWHIWFIAIVALFVIVLFGVLIYFKSKGKTGRKFSLVDETEMAANNGVSNGGYMKDNKKK